MKMIDTVVHLITTYEELIKLYDNRDNNTYDIKPNMTHSAIKYKAYLSGKIDALKSVLKTPKPE